MSDIYQITRDDFPELLREIPDPPEKLYVKGNLPSKQQKVLCVVGSRKYTTYGKQVAETLISSLHGLPVTIVSGLALGIDGLAHQSALQAKLHTIGVPGSGLANDMIAPRSNYALAQNILTSGGALLSEYEPDMKASPWMFPQRNRIMAGLAHAILVIEAGERSGTLITARLAGEYNRDVLSVPGSIFNTNSHGTNALIKDGATPVLSASDLKDALGFTDTDMQTKTIPWADLSENEKIIIDLLQEITSRDELIRISGMSASSANMTITALEMKGVIKEEMGEVRLCM